ncbi:MAG TPA: GNAT family N-acetyltransferase, partial [Fimbriimonadaceae bacterium]|nr:GNAT family N-acetyltransferase [Fimbriimonadaceae bacterium]
EGEDLVGLMPLYVSTGAWRALRAIGTGASDYLHPVCRRGHESGIAQALLEHLAERPAGDVIDLHQVREDAPGSSLRSSQIQTIEQATCLVLDLPSTFDDYLKTLSKSLRYDVRRLDKSAFSEGGRIKAATPDNLDDALNVFFRTHRERWRKRGLPGAFGKKSERFQREWAHIAARQGWLWLSTLQWQGESVGSIYAMRLGQVCYFYQAGFDPEAKAISPGTLLVARTIRRAIEEGLERFDFLRGDEPYKRRWKPQHAYKNLRFIKAGPSVRGDFAAAWNRLGWKVEERVRARLEGRGLLG